MFKNIVHFIFRLMKIFLHALIIFKKKSSYNADIFRESHGFTLKTKLICLQISLTLKIIPFK